MHRFYCASIAPHLQGCKIDDPDEVHHIIRVLRLKVGEDIELINGLGDLAVGRLRSVSKTDIEVELIKYQDGSCPENVKIVLACALPKKSKFDDIIEKCTELGVDEIVPLVTERTEVVPCKGARERMSGRFNKVVLSASKQCKRLWFPKIHPVTPFEDAVNIFAKDGNLMCIPWLEGERRTLKDILSRLDTDLNLKCFVFFIGPEGDFTSKEVAVATGKGAIPVSLGGTVLRVETAAIAVTAYARFCTLRS